MRVLVFEPDHTGHRFSYVRFILGALRELPVDVTLAIGEQAPATPEFNTQIRPNLHGVEITTVSPTLGYSPLKAALTRARGIADVVRRAEPAHVLIPYADGLSQVLAVTARLPGRGLPRCAEFEALVMRGGFAYPTAGLNAATRARASFALVRAAPWSRVHMIDPIAYNAVARRYPRFAARCHLMPDPVEPSTPVSRSEARRRLGIPVDGRYIGCAGVLDERKGMDLLIRAFAAARLSDSDRLLLAGPLTPGVRRVLGEVGRSVRDRIVCLDRYFSDVGADSEFMTAIAATDVVCTPYPRHIGSASIVIRAAAAGRPVLGSTFGWVGHTIPTHELGATVDVADANAFSHALLASLHAATTHVTSPRAAEFVNFHSPARFAKCWTARLRARLEAAPRPDGADAMSGEKASMV